MATADNPVRRIPTKRLVTISAVDAVVKVTKTAVCQNGSAHTGSLLLLERPTWMLTLKSPVSGSSINLVLHASWKLTVEQTQRPPIQATEELEAKGPGHEVIPFQESRQSTSVEQLKKSVPSPGGGIEPASVKLASTLRTKFSRIFTRPERTLSGK